jgi:aminopeptidase N
MNKLFFGLLAFACWTSCNTPRQTATTIPVRTDTAAVAAAEDRDVDSLDINSEMNEADYVLNDADSSVMDATLPRYNPSHTRVNDLLHTKLDLRFNWEKEQVIGKATLRFKPYFYPTNTLTLDAKYFNLQKVNFEGKNEPLKYAYNDSTELVIDLGRSFKRGEEYTIYIEYTATPTASGGSDAITSNQGLFFIDPRNEDPDKPSQIWTQGETNWNSRWFPTIDHPNERTTQEIYLTVEDKYATVSNGLLVASKKNADGTRTDYWRMDQPHAPYLFMLAVGEFAIVKDQWRDVPLMYYVEPAYKDHAKAIFGRTPQMLEFFSNKLGVKYPWKKFAQIIVRDYVSGAMENTTAVIFGEFIQKKTRELIDNNNDGIVAHEMFHHWFGDYVTTESWSNLTLNEGFANYSEYLWAEHQYGKDQADYDLLNTVNGYISSTQGGGRHPLIHFGYENNEQMFDAHSYNKGGAILHMLRNYVGDEAFWAALNLYLTRHAYKSVEAHDLRLAFEEVTGEDLNWFFNQWFFAEGHPILKVSHEYDEAAKTVTLTVEQTQKGKGVPGVFVIPATVDIYTAAGQVRHEKIRTGERRQTFTFENVNQAPQLVNFDASKTLVAELEHQKSEAELVFQYANAPTFYDRYEALQKLIELGSERAPEIATTALKDKFWVLRMIALGQVYENADDATKATMRQMAASDPRSQVRAGALELLAELNDVASVDIAKKAIERDSAYNVVAAGLQALVKLDSVQALQYAQKLEKEEEPGILAALASLYAKSGDATYLPFYEKNFTKVQTYDALGLVESYQQLAARLDFNAAMAAMEKLRQLGLDQSVSQWHRFAAIRSINDLRNDYNQRAKLADAAAKAELEQRIATLTQMMDAIKAAEKDPQIIGLYDQLIIME